MSITFSLKNHSHEFSVISPHYNPDEPEDVIYNPKYDVLDVYPALNLANSNAAALLRSLSISPSDAGEIAADRLPSLLEFVRGHRLSDAVSVQGLVLTKYAPKLEELVSLAVSLNDSITWG